MHSSFSIVSIDRCRIPINSVSSALLFITINSCKSTIARIQMPSYRSVFLLPLFKSTDNYSISISNVQSQAALVSILICPLEKHFILTQKWWIPRQQACVTIMSHSGGNSPRAQKDSRVAARVHPILLLIKMLFLRFSTSSLFSNFHKASFLFFCHSFIQEIPSMLSLHRYSNLLASVLSCHPAST